MGHQQRPKDLDEEIADLDRVLQTLREEENVEVLLETTLGYLQAEFDWRLIWIGLYDRQAHRLLGKGGMTPNGDLSFLKQRFALNPGDLLEQVVIELQPVDVPDLRSENRAGEWRKAAQNFNVQGTTLFPLRYKDRCYGVILLGTDEWGASPKSAPKTQLAIVFGALATALYQIEKDWQLQQVKRPDESLLLLISQLRELRSIDQYLQAVVEQAHEFIEPTRTNVYWFEPERRYFWRRVSNRQVAPGLGPKRPASGITVQDLGEFYQALTGEQMVWIGESHSSLKTELTARLMQQIRARSLLAAPIVSEGELLGFLAVEATEPRIWLDNEKHYLRGAAQLVALIAPLSEMEEKIQQTQLDRDLTAGIARAIYSDADWEVTLKNTAEQLCSRLKCEYFLLLLYGEEQNRFEIVCQNLPRNRRPVPSPLNSLDAADLLLLQACGEPLAIENWEEDRRLGAWREVLAESGVRSLLASNTKGKKAKSENRNPKSLIENRKSIEGLLVVGHSATRTWKGAERELVQVVSQQLGLILHSWQQSSQIDKYQQFWRSLESGLAVLQHSGEEESQQQKSASAMIFSDLRRPKLDRNFARDVSQTISCPLVAVITWHPGQEFASIAAAVAANPVFALNPEAVIPVQTDALIQQTLARGGVLQQNTSQLALATKGWLRSPGIGEILAVALQTAPEHAPAGIVIVADVSGREWSELSVNLLRSMVSHLAWWHRYLAVQSAAESQRLDLEMLNWYKQRRFEDFYRIVGAGVKELGELSQSILQSAKEQKDALKTLRYQQVLRQIGNALGSAHLMLKHEPWRLQFGQDAVSVSGWLRRSLDRAAPMVKQSEILLEVNAQTAVSLPAGKTLSVRADSIKLDLILCELLAMACRRSSVGDKIEIRTEVLGEDLLELSVIDSGLKCDRQLIAVFNDNFHPDILVVSPYVSSHRSIVQNLLICQRAVHLMGGNFSLEMLENNLIVARLVLPLAKS
ncbi:GAF domain-containing protein [Microcoleus sp. LEGE 07076]|uniref:sensor histidine kinase n=1 Tax=Microcoleus sp. LEGE 07076 TaxID=915322 RepID=UPI0018811E2A|nr:GAF domain-containing protein [Microcoleus sp. LEGE 07076]MBE9183687.1 GAF domain-containing protein [Microcoleus sp. LEGE 07076]